jgi:hypothetical protein
MPTASTAYPDHTIILWQIDDVDGLMVKACERLRPYLRWAPALGDADRAICNNVETALRN